MPEPFKFFKAFDISLPALGKSVSVVLKGLAVLFVIWFLYCSLIKPFLHPNPTTSQKAESLTNNYNDPKATFGCASVKVMLFNDKENNSTK